MIPTTNAPSARWRRSGTLPLAALQALRSVPASHVAALLVGALVFLVVLGPGFLTGHAPFLETPLGDVAAEQASYLMVARAPWQLPIFALPDVNTPEGANAVFMGGMPLYALFARLLRPLVGQSTAMLGAWYLICYTLQAHSFFVLMRQVTRKEPLILALATLSGVLAYAFVTRFGHISLCAQFTVVYAMAAAMQTQREGEDWGKALTWLALLNIIALLIFAYLAVPTFALFGGAVWGLLNKRKISLARAVAVTGAFLALMLAIAGLAGFFWSVQRAEPVNMSSYSELGFNIGSMFIPPQSVLFPGQDLIRAWWGGDFYLGIGVMALLVLAVLRDGRAIGMTVVRNWPLAVVLLLLLVYAISNRVAFGSYILFEYPLPAWLEPVLGIVRSGGRLFWPIGYLVMATAFGIVVRAYSRRVSLSLVGVAVLLSMLEASGSISFVRSHAFTPPHLPISWSGLQAVMDAHRGVQVYPSFWCNPGADETPKRRLHAEIQLTSARAGLTSNSTITVRKMKDCDRERATMRENVLRKGDLDIFTSPQTAQAALEDRPEAVSGACREFDLEASTAVMCSADWTNTTTLPIPELRSLIALWPVLSVNETIDFGIHGDWERFIGAGWWVASDGATTWTEGDKSNLRFTIAASAGSRRLSLAVKAIPAVGPAAPARVVDVALNGRRVARWSFDRMEMSTRMVEIPPDLVPGNVTVSFDEDGHRSFKEQGLGDDPRHGGLAVQSISLSADLPARP